MGREKAENPKQYTLEISEKYFQNLEEIVEYIAFEAPTFKRN